MIIDVSPSYSDLPTPAQLDALKPYCQGVLVGGEFPDWQKIRDYLDAYLTIGCPVGVYGFVEFQGDPLASLDNALRGADGRAIAWFEVDLELPVYGHTTASVLNFCSEGMRHARDSRPDAETLAYTGPWWWNASTGGSTDTLGVRGSIAGGPYYNSRDEALVPDLARVPDCGGWTKTAGNIALWQYQGTIDTEGINTDRSVWIGAPVQEDEMAERVWCAERFQTWIVGKFGAAPVAYPVDDVIWASLYGPHARVMTGAELDALAPK